MANTYEKVDDYSFKVTKTTTTTQGVTYQYDDLVAQITRINTDLANYTAARTAEIEEVKTLIAEAEKLEIKSKYAEAKQVVETVEE